MAIAAALALANVVGPQAHRHTLQAIERCPNITQATALVVL
jgi:hypothetical protein